MINLYLIFLEQTRYSLPNQSGLLYKQILEIEPPTKPVFSKNRKQIQQQNKRISFPLMNDHVYNFGDAIRPHTSVSLTFTIATAYQTKNPRGICWT